jgi:hypothetical protein
MTNQKKQIHIIITVITILILLTSLAAAAPAEAELSKIRTSQTPERVRIVLDLNRIPAYSVNLINDLSYIQIDLPGTLNKGALPQTVFNDTHVAGLRLLELEPGRQRIYIDLKMAVTFNVFTLKNPNRLVIDIHRIFEQKIQEEVVPGITHTYWLRGQRNGPVSANILEVDLTKGFRLKPLLANGAVQGLETLSSMSENAKAVAAVNGAYFAPNGEIIGLFKMDGEIVSTPAIARTAVGMMPDGKIITDQVAYSGSVKLPGGKTVKISAVNCERGDNELVLYNGYFGGTTRTNPYGMEYVVTNGRVSAVNTSNSLIPAGGYVLSVHGEAAKALAGLGVGDAVGIIQSLGPVWDKAVDALGAGPSLIRNGNIYLTTKVEEFGSDVAGGRAPRTALGITKEGRLLLVTVDGRQSHSVGLTLWDLAVFMQELGAVEAMNLDGGGSSEMVIYDRVINKPSDGRERRVGSALAIVSSKLAN